MVAQIFFRFTPRKKFCVFLRLYSMKHTKVNNFTKRQLILGLLTKVNRFTMMQNVSAISLLQCSAEFTQSRSGVLRMEGIPFQPVK